MRKIQSTFMRSPAKTLVAIGDSLTMNFGSGVAVHSYWPEPLTASLRSLGVPIKARNVAVDGSTSLEMLLRQSSETQFDVPTLGVIFAGHNDMGKSGTLAAGSGNTGRTITVTLQSSLGQNTAGVVGSAIAFISWNGGANKATGVTVTGWTSTTITISTTSGDNLPSGSTAVTVRIDSKAHIKSMAEYLFAAGCGKILICSTHFQNFNGGGDNSAGNVPYAAPQAGTRLDLWAAQHDAATELSAMHPGQVAFCDLYAAMYDVLTNASNPFYQAGKAGVDAFWHVGTGNTHMNATGNKIVAVAILATLQNQSGWLNSLKA